MVARPVREKDRGLKVWYNSQADPDEIVDIVAVHGIGAHPDDTWCQIVVRDPDDSDNELLPGELDPLPRKINWLKDPNMLPRAIPKSRIMRFGYESQWFGEGAIAQKVSIVASDLLTSLKRARNETPKRPLIFIAHCFGGLVVLKALIEAHLEPKLWPNILTSTTGEVFFGTPFRGASGMDQTQLLAAAIEEYGEDNVQGSVLNILASGSETLLDLRDTYQKTMRQYKVQSQVACFFELKPSDVGKIVGSTGGKRFVVDETSGCLDLSESTKKYSLSRTHFNVNKFADFGSHEFQTVCEVLVEMAAQAHALLASRNQCK